MKRDLREFRRLERVCLEQAALSTMDLTRIGLLQVAHDCRIAAEAIEAKAAPSPLAHAIHVLRHAFVGRRPLN